MLFAEQGYDGWTMKELATRAECAVGLLYRYYPSREALVLALYAELAQSLEARASALGAGTVGARFVELVGWKLAELDRRPRAFRALARAALSPDDGARVLGDETKHVRAVGVRAFTEVVSHATNAPADAAPLGRVLYGLHLLVVLVWTQRRRRDETLSDALAELAPLLDLAVMASSTPLFAPALARVDALARSLLEDFS